MDASCPSNRLAAVTNRNGTVLAARSGVSFSASSLIPSLSNLRCCWAAKAVSISLERSEPADSDRE
jgi:hypothetical protein